MILRRHDRYFARQYLVSMLTSLAFLSLLVIVFDVADRIDDLPKVAKQIEAAGRTRVGLLVEYYATLLPFLWMKLIPFSALIAAGLVFTWLARANELSPVVTAGVPSLRLLAPILGIGVLLVTGMTVARETVVPDLARRHDDLHRVFKRSGRGDRLTDVKHLFDRDGGRVSMTAYLPAQRRLEAAWVTFRRQATPAGPRDVAHYYPVLDWDAASESWVATKGGTRCVLDPVESGADATAVAPGAKAPVAMRPSLLELTLRQGTALGFSSAEIATLADAYPDNPRFRLLLHQQWAAPVGTLVLLLLGLPMVYRLGRSNVFRSFGATCALAAAYFLADAVLTDMGARGALNPVVAAWAAHVVFGALGVVLMSSVDT
jgi:lipopolysaccharide export system permease protein